MKLAGFEVEARGDKYEFSPPVGLPANKLAPFLPARQRGAERKGSREAAVGNRDGLSAADDRPQPLVALYGH